MTLTDESNEIIEYLLAGRARSREDEIAVIQKLNAMFPKHLVDLIIRYVDSNHRLETGLKESKAIQREMKLLIDKLTAIPWYSATVIRKESGCPGRALVALGGARMTMECAEEVDPDRLEEGQRIFVSQEKNVIIGVDSGPPFCSEIGVVEELQGNRIIVKAREMEEIPLTQAYTLQDSDLKTGDRVLFDRQLGFAYEVLPGEKKDTDVLEEVDSDVTLDMIGGMDAIKNDICDEIVLQLLYPEISRRHKMRPAKGILLLSAPGNGKTMLAKALCNFIREIFDASEVKFLSMPPGGHRHWLYGMSDQIIIKTFKAAREFTKKKGNKVIIFMDEIDSLGRRSNEMGNSIDSRIMGTLLAQIDGTNDSGDILLIGAANRADDRLDTALMRPGRLADRVYRIPTPDREAARGIFSMYLTEDLPYRNNDGRLAGNEARQHFIDAAVTRLYAPAGPLAQIGTLVMRDGSRRPVRGADLVSGAIIENIVRKSKYAACRRAVRGTDGILLEDLLGALDAEIYSAARVLKSPVNARDILGLGIDTDFRVELSDNPENPETTPYLFIRS